PIGIVWFILYYIIFRFLINKFNFKTPGREAETTTETVETTERAKTIIEGLGGKENIEIVDCCATRLRVTLKSDAPVNKQLLNSTEARGIIQKGNGVQIVYGPHVTTIKNEVEELLDSEQA
ncbi:glucose PTS transporter subunit EIIB, partial [Staphylococcus ureilyticus]|nr:glucose PTS transporter subunit EIIB [Staphylococcus ureilyticus]